LASGFKVNSRTLRYETRIVEKAAMVRSESSVVLNIRIDAALRAELQRLADRDRRPLSSWIKLLLEDAVKDAKGRKG
jgi:hypothetical protein